MRQNAILTKKRHFLQKKGASNFNTPYSKVLQQNKFFLILHERGQHPKVGHSFCLVLGLLDLFYQVSFLCGCSLVFEINTIQLCMEYCCKVLTGASSCYLDILDKLQRWISMTIDPSPGVSLEPLAYHQNVASLNLFYRFNWIGWAGSTSSFSWWVHSIF